MVWPRHVLYNRFPIPYLGIKSVTCVLNQGLLTYGPLTICGWSVDVSVQCSFLDRNILFSASAHFKWHRIVISDLVELKRM
jgi:hypothetical protein